MMLQEECRGERRSLRRAPNGVQRAGYRAPQARVGSQARSEWRRSMHRHEEREDTQNLRVQRARRWYSARSVSRLQRVFAHRVQQAVTRLGGVGPHDNQRFFDKQRGESRKRLTRRRHRPSIPLARPRASNRLRRFRAGGTWTFLRAKAGRDSSRASRVASAGAAKRRQSRSPGAENDFRGVRPRPAV